MFLRLTIFKHRLTRIPAKGCWSERGQLKSNFLKETLNIAKWQETIVSSSCHLNHRLCLSNILAQVNSSLLYSFTALSLSFFPSLCLTFTSLQMKDPLSLLPSLHPTSPNKAFCDPTVVISKPMQNRIDLESGLPPPPCFAREGFTYDINKH